MSVQISDFHIKLQPLPSVRDDFYLFSRVEKYCEKRTGFSSYKKNLNLEIQLSVNQTSASYRWQNLKLIYVPEKKVTTVRFTGRAKLNLTRVNIEVGKTCTLANSQLSKVCLGPKLDVRKGRRDNYQ